jgi:molybdopterin-containing oxidoreductase family iron-sulfur binding subunit
MVIDLQRCIGCWSCTVACKQEHFLPPGIFWNRVLIGETGKYPAVQKEMVPILCNHCKDAVCVDVCPTGASTKREDGIVLVDYETCMGCGYCVVSCPYQHRSFYRDENLKGYFQHRNYTAMEVLGQELYPLVKGTVVKCTFCKERIDQSLKERLKAGVDRKATPACVNACVTKARTFGDLDDPTSQIVSLIKERSGHPFHPEFGTDPSVYYILR